MLEVVGGERRRKELMVAGGGSAMELGGGPGQRAALIGEREVEPLGI
jgi:hypothetical protein